MDSYTMTLPWVLEDRDRLVAENVGIAHKYASRFYRGEAETEDIVSAAVCGLIEAADRWVDGRAKKTKSFQSVAFHYIRKYVVAHVFGTRNSIRIPRHTQLLMGRYERFARRHRAETGRNPSVSEAGEKLGMGRKDRATLRQALKVSRAETLSWDSQIDMEDARGRLGILRADDRDEVEAALASMTRRQREVVVAWAESGDLSATARAVGVSRSAVEGVIGRGTNRARKGAA